MTDDENKFKGPSVAVLIEEEFFFERTVKALEALTVTPLLFDSITDQDCLDSLIAAQPIGIVVDLEDESFHGLSLVAAIRATPELSQVPYIAYAAFDREDIHASAAALGVDVVLRSEYAANLVKMFQSFLPKNNESGES